MRKDNITLPEDVILRFLKFYSDSGNIQASDRFLQYFTTGLMMYFFFPQKEDFLLLAQVLPPKRNDTFI